ncbi:MAG: reverse transcriptase domain-containing protein [bacterium]|nr:reverse transcriptase domain-containing protein [bacterium]
MFFLTEILGLDLLLLGETPAFRSFSIKDRNPVSGVYKKNRQLEAPNHAMSIIHGRLIRYLRSLQIQLPYATACRPGDSPLKNVENHRNSRFFFLLDLRSAYRGVDMKMLAEALCREDARLQEHVPEVQEFLEQYCRSQFGGLATGAPASPDLFNLYCASLLDEPIGSRTKGWTYTRYLDDLTISGDMPISRKMREDIRDIVGRAGFDVNHTKAQVLDLRKGQIAINGVGLEFGGRIFVPRSYVTHVTGLLHAALLGDESVRFQVEGAMGVFKQITGRKNQNRTEQRVLTLYKKFRRGTQYKRKKAMP